MVPEVPVPVAPDVIESHAALDVAVQPQVAPFVVTENAPVPPATPKEADAAPNATAHPAASCVTKWV